MCPLGVKKSQTNLVGLFELGVGTLEDFRTFLVSFKAALVLNIRSTHFTDLHATISVTQLHFLTS